VGTVQLGGPVSTGDIDISTAARISSGVVLNVLDTTSTTFTNLSQDSAVLAGNAPDTISGTLTVRSYNNFTGVMDVTFNNVVLESVRADGFCTLNGTLTTTGTGAQ
jgi:hypothetical protein